jgi:hypothetical protein
VGYASAVLIGDYEHDYERMVRAARGFYALFPGDYRFQYPEQPWGTDPLSLAYYSTREKPQGTVINYALQPADKARPAGMTAVHEDDGVAVYVRDLKLWQWHRERETPRVVISPLYDPILRHTYDFFGTWMEQSRTRFQGAHFQEVRSLFGAPVRSIGRVRRYVTSVSGGRF